eukprot:1141539-Pelagomonas_calceolata.AAC.7
MDYLSASALPTFCTNCAVRFAGLGSCFAHPRGLYPWAPAPLPPADPAMLCYFCPLCYQSSVLPALPLPCVRPGLRD